MVVVGIVGERLELCGLEPKACYRGGGGGPGPADDELELERGQCPVTPGRVGKRTAYISTSGAATTT